MELTFIAIVVGIIATAITYFILSVIIREIAVLFKIKPSTFHTSSIVAGVVCVLLFAQFLVSEVTWLSGIILAAAILSLFYMIQREYEVSTLKALMMGIASLIAMAILILLLAGIALLI
jgi:hypothetical protein